MKKVFKKTGIIIAIIIFIYFLYWLHWGRILVIDIGDNQLSEVINLDYFESLHPDMSRTEISQKMGQPTMIDVPDVDEDIDYIEIRWIYERPEGSLNYYVMQKDIPGGSVEYIPEDMVLNKFLFNPPKSLFGKSFVEIRSNKDKLMTIRMGWDKKVKKINWYYQN